VLRPPGADRHALNQVIGHLDLLATISMFSSAAKLADRYRALRESLGTKAFCARDLADLENRLIAEFELVASRMLIPALAGAAAVATINLSVAGSRTTFGRTLRGTLAV
jgi:hypothetical protein